ncbi:hypothetical protein NKI36_29910 [Mesorhizobium caraganae]|uniref:Helix-turn-helix domain-containing protein n=1 Tax=Mesorhizobium caraganae TaxID=483206 RepID=A0ABV1Z8X1_9HYPH
MKTAAEKRAYIRDHRSHGLSVAEGCGLMGLSRTTFYDQPRSAADDTAIVEAIAAICDEFEHYGWRRACRSSAKRHDRQSKKDPPLDARA